MLCAVGAVEQLRGARQPVLSDPKAMEALIRGAEARGFEFEDCLQCPLRLVTRSASAFRRGAPSAATRPDR